MLSRPPTLNVDWSISSSSSRSRSFTAWPLEMVTTWLPATSITTSSPPVGTLPRLQLDAVAQSPEAAIQRLTMLSSVRVTVAAPYAVATFTSVGALTVANVPLTEPAVRMVKLSFSAPV
jgi:hypothetical protein